MNSPAGSIRLFAVLTLAFFPFPAPAAEAIDEIVVTADLRGRSENEIPASVTVVDADEIRELATQHFEELINIVPNLNWSGDGHRARYLQIRGVGELEQYQGAPNPSVGFLIDDIDFSGIGTIATLFDVDRVEVLRGPQGSRYGANALAGLVYMQSTMPSAERNGRLQFSAGDDDSLSAGIALGGSLSADDRALFRISAQHHRSNGFRDNAYLARDDTNGRDETVVRGRLSLQPTEAVNVNLAALYSKVDNGYDAFALDNSYTMLSDKPGRDAQESLGASARVEWFGLPGLSLTSITALADSRIDFSFDADWGNDDSWAPVTYDYVSINDRERKTLSQEFRLATDNDSATAWLVGLYVLQLDDDLLTINQGDYYDPFYDFADSLDETLDSSYEATSIAAFGQFETRIGPATRVSAGLRVERRTSEYSDSVGLSIGPSDSLAGGEITLSHDHSDSLTSFASVSKGYKAGGFNLGAVPDERREFGAEALWSLEAGFKSTWLDERLDLNASIFVTRRDDQQVRISFQLEPGNPASFGFATANAERGSSVGLEADVRWIAGESWEYYASIGMLETEFEGFQLQPGLVGRSQAHAPRYTFAAGASYRHPSGWFTRIDTTARDEFYFDVSHNQESDAYALVHAGVGFEADGWTAQLRVRNLFDTEYAVRGFYFGNEPPDFPNALYMRLGDARQVGLTFDKRF